MFLILEFYGYRQFLLPDLTFVRPIGRCSSQTRILVANWVFVIATCGCCEQVRIWDNNHDFVACCRVYASRSAPTVQYSEFSRAIGGFCVHFQILVCDFDFLRPIFNSYVRFGIWAPEFRTGHKFCKLDMRIGNWTRDFAIIRKIREPSTRMTSRT